MTTEPGWELKTTLEERAWAWHNEELAVCTEGEPEKKCCVFWSDGAVQKKTYRLSGHVDTEEWGGALLGRPLLCLPVQDAETKRSFAWVTQAQAQELRRRYRVCPVDPEALSLLIAAARAALDRVQQKVSTLSSLMPHEKQALEALVEQTVSCFSVVK